MSESDSSSLNSVELDGLGMAGAVDSDTGLESMSSAETPSGKPCSLCCDTQNDSRVESLRQDVTRLKCDKLELLRQNVVSEGFLFSHTIHYGDHYFFTINLLISHLSTFFVPIKTKYINSPHSRAEITECHLIYNILIN